MSNISPPQPEESRVFILVEKLRPGDVILCMGGEKFSKLIANVTQSSFSHAILVVSENRWFEADDDGVGFSDAWALGGFIRGNKVYSRVAELPGYTNARVLRHPALSTHDPKEIESALIKTLQPWDGGDYSDFRRLAYPLEVTGKSSWWVRLGLAFYQWKERRRNPGMFCSEVVARAYEALATSLRLGTLSLFATTRRADMVAPGHLATSNLEAIKNIVFDVTTLPAGYQLERDIISLNRRHPTHTALRARWMDEVRAKLNEESAATLELLRQRHARLEYELRKAIDEAHYFHLPKVGDQCQALLLELTDLSRQVEEYFQSDRKTDKSRELTDARIALRFKVREIRLLLLAEFLKQEHCDQERIARIIGPKRKALEADRQEVRKKLNELRKGDTPENE